MRRLRNIRALSVVLWAAMSCRQSTPVAALPDASASDAGRSSIDAAAPDATLADEDGDGFPAGVDCDDRNLSIHPGAPEACNGLDDDCDEERDEGLGEGFCGVGVCRRALPFCVNGRAARCEPGPPSAEACNGLDDDCDGAIDEEIAGAECGVGACRRRSACVDARMSMCEPGAPRSETCNGEDDDCDGVVDQGFRAEYVQGDYTALSGHHPGCTAVGQRIGPECNAAMHRFCAGRPCKQSGFGPLENNGDRADVLCVAAQVVETSYLTLAAHHELCDGTRERRGPNCNAAMHRFCAARGAPTGFGPLENSGDRVFVACVPSAEVVGSSYTALRGQHPPCDGAGEREGPNCNAAISRLCRSMGFVSGFGPVENSGDLAAIACVRP